MEVEYVTEVAYNFLSVFYVFTQSLYDSIKNEPFKIPEDDGNDLTHTFFNPDKEGWLMKQGRSWYQSVLTFSYKFIFLYLWVYHST